MLCRKCQSWWSIPRGTVECPVCGGKLESDWTNALGKRVKKITGDYRFEGEIVAEFKKRNGSLRYVVENDDGILHIFSAANLDLSDN